MPKLRLLAAALLISAGACSPKHPPVAESESPSPALGHARGYEQIFRLIARDLADLIADEDWEPSRRELLRLAAESTVRRHHRVGDYDLVFSVEAQYYGNDDLCGIRGAHNGGNFYVFGRRGKRYEHLGTLCGDSVSTGSLNDQLYFITRSHWGASQHQHRKYMWKGGKFRLAEDKRHSGNEKGEVVVRDLTKAKQVPK
jgi:hypothetical protein